MKPITRLALAMLAGLFANSLSADSIPDPKLSLSGGSGSTPVGLGPFSFNLNEQGGGIFDFCNNTGFGDDSEATCENPPGDSKAQSSANLEDQNGVTFDSMSFTTEFPTGQTLFTCQSDLFAFCTFTLNGDGTITVDFFGTGYQDGNGTGSASFGDDVNFFPGIPPGGHFYADFNDDPNCRPTPDSPCAASWVPGANVTGQANAPEPGSWILLGTAATMLAGRKRGANAARRLTRIAARFL